MPTQIKDYTQIIEIRGESFEITAPARFDSVTGTLLYDEALDDAAIETAQALYRQKHDIVSPQELVSFRARLEISGRDLAALLGFSPTRIGLYENGALPTPNNAIQLKNALHSKQFLRDFYDSNKDKLSEKTREKVAAYLEATRPTIDRLIWQKLDNTINEIEDPDIQKKIKHYLAENFSASKY